MKKLIYIILIGLGLLCTVRNSFAQIIDANKFDVERFESKKINGEVNDTLKDGTLVRQYDSKDEFTEAIVRLNSPFILYNSYFKKTGNLRATGTQYSGCTIGLWNEYDENGELVRQINQDQNYSFSIYDLAAKLKKELNIDIMQSSSHNWSVNRGIGNQSYYQVVIGPACKCSHRVLIIDGKTGKTTSDSIVPYPDGPDN